MSSLVAPATEYLEASITAFLATRPDDEVYTALVIECCPFDWGINIHLRPADTYAPIGSTADDEFDGWRHSHAEILEDQSFLDAACSALCKQLEAVAPGWQRSYEQIIEDVTRAALAVEERGLLGSPHFDASLVWYVFAQDEPDVAGARARLDRARANNLEPGWSLGYLR